MARAPRLAEPFGHLALDRFTRKEKPHGKTPAEEKPEDQPTNDKQGEAPVSA